MGAPKETLITILELLFIHVTDLDTIRYYSTLILPRSSNTVSACHLSLSKPAASSDPRMASPLDSFSSMRFPPSALRSLLGSHIHRRFKGLIRGGQ
ncbi:hypothetical protein F5B21DRAFT_481179 [Xylaria acuta]|nr:hypothetical protein F5B21DRAFT_481179 [Xylaria acuta]